MVDRETVVADAERILAGRFSAETIEAIVRSTKRLADVLEKHNIPAEACGDIANIFASSTGEAFDDRDASTALAVRRKIERDAARDLLADTLRDSKALRAKIEDLGKDLEAQRRAAAYWWTEWHAVQGKPRPTATDEATEAACKEIEALRKKLVECGLRLGEQAKEIDALRWELAALITGEG